MANPHKGEVEIKLNKSVAKGYLHPRGPIVLKFDYNTMADVETEFRNGASLLKVLDSGDKDPASVSFYDMRALFSAGLKHQFRTMTPRLAGEILNLEDFGYVLGKLGEAVGLAFDGTISGAPKKEGDDFVKGADEFVGEEQIETAEEAEKN